MKEFERFNNLGSNLSTDDNPERGATHLSYLGDGLLDILDALPFYVLLIDKSHRILLANKATRDTLGMDASELVGRYCPRAVHGLEHGSYPGCPLEQAVTSKKAVEMEHYDEKTKKWLKIAVYPTDAWSVDGQGVYLHMIQDITAQKTSADSHTNLDKSIALP
jgi:PAS domain S-box-containing protein